MFAKLLLPFILIPIADLVLLWMISSTIGWGNSILLIVVSGILGAWLASQQSKFVQSKIKERLSQNQMPTDLLSDGAMIFFAAGLLITPGLITDVMGLSLLIPRIRQVYKKLAMKFFKKHFKVQIVTPPSQQRPHDPNIIDGEVIGSSSDSDSL